MDREFLIWIGLCVAYAAALVGGIVTQRANARAAAKNAAQHWFLLKAARGYGRSFRKENPRPR
jgi:hypothetical protein